ncbi:hypothetical protein CYMTET_39094 [Cymbomonas tetramitiformis]|uniref:DUF1499 domain-containing protein n=1 Tax=Cymbomonas tetramitiformis TaxID=36881 RepID=A0AAE0F5X7_9CHLO|nr:hypothetical protein CYMTET_39094 [Cymbomonas tetramitiformis]
MQYDGPKYPKRKGSKPADLGPRPDGSLKGCDFVKPNCFSTSVLDEDELAELSVGYLIPPFEYTKSQSEAMQDLVSVIKAYIPGQNKIDGGGFKIITQTDNYLYIQFQSLKYGYIDDVEFSLKDDRVNMRSSSRLGYLDFGVNAKRLNFISEKLGLLDGWKTSQITASTHPGYFEKNIR